MLAEPHPRQDERLAILRDFGILDTPRERRYDQIVELVAEVCDAPIAVINLVDEKRQWFKAETGLGVRETPLETSICAHIILEPGLTVIPDTLLDRRMRNNPLCHGEPNLRFYAGAVLATEAGLPLGTLCVLDTRPRDLTEIQRKFLTVLAEQVMVQMTLNRQLVMAELLRQEVDHRVKNSLSIVSGCLSLQIRDSANADVRKALDETQARVRAVSTVHELLFDATNSVKSVDLAAYLHRVATLGVEQAGEGVRLSVDAPVAYVSPSTAGNIGLIVGELISNALRHAFPDGRPGHLKVSGERLERTVRLSVSDDGGGLPADFAPDRSSGLGMRLALMLAKSFGSELSWRSDASGACFSFEAPLDER